MQAANNKGADQTARMLCCSHMAKETFSHDIAQL